VLPASVSSLSLPRRAADCCLAEALLLLPLIHPITWTSPSPGQIQLLPKGGGMPSPARHLSTQCTLLTERSSTKQEQAKQTLSVTDNRHC